MNKVEKLQLRQGVTPIQCNSAAVSSIRFLAMAALLTAVGCGSDAPTKDGHDNGREVDVSSADASGGVEVNSGVDINDNFIPCKVGDGDYCKTQAGTMGKSADCVNVKCIPLYDADPNSAGVCKFGDLVDGAGCDDGDKCTVDDQCGEGVCSGEDLKCEWDNDPCHKKMCDSKTGECNGPVPEGGACDDETKCTFGGKCNEDGECQPGLFIPDTAVSCDDGDVCTQDYCQAGEGCQHEPLNTKPCEDDGNPCNGKEVCDPTSPTGCKSINPLPDDTLCTTTDLCALESWCQSGECVTKVEKDCNDGNECTNDKCAEDECVHDDVYHCYTLYKDLLCCELNGVGDCSDEAFPEYKYATIDFWCNEDKFTHIKEQGFVTGECMTGETGDACEAELAKKYFPEE